MRFLKKKIFFSQQLKLKQEEQEQDVLHHAKIHHDDEVSTSQATEGSTSGEDFEPKKRSNKNSSSSMPKTPERIRCTKNIVKNYGRTIASFACMDIAQPYLNPMLEEHGISYKTAMAFFSKAKTAIQGIDTFRAVVLARPQDSPLDAALKVVFQKIGEVFIKDFSVNWIFHSKIQHKQAYLKYRFKMIRRLRNPELFTYLKG